MYDVAGLQRVKEQIDSKVREGGVKPREGVDLQNFYEEVLNGYTYVDSSLGNATANGWLFGLQSTWSIFDDWNFFSLFRIVSGER